MIKIFSNLPSFKKKRLAYDGSLNMSVFDISLFKEIESKNLIIRKIGRAKNSRYFIHSGVNPVHLASSIISFFRYLFLMVAPWS